LAIIPGAGGTQRLPRVLGLTKAKELVYMAKRLSGKESEEIGLVTECVQDGQALQRAVEIAERINLGGPVALRMAKAAINEGTQGSLKEGLEVEGRCYGTVIPTKDRIEGLKAFAEKRKPEYVGA
jgi:methylglutaconyl-CoA hydratase